jgi:hypothetical protein
MILMEISAIHGVSDVSVRATASILLTRTAGKPRYGQIYIYDSETALYFCTSENRMPSVLTIAVQVKERIPYAQKHGN